MSATTSGEVVTLYSGRSEELIGPALEKFERATGIQVNVRYGGTSEMAALLMEEGSRSPADVFFAQDAGALGAVGGLLAPLPKTLLDRVEPRFQAADGRWVGITGRARVVVYNTGQRSEADLPPTIYGFTEPQWKGRFGWAPTNGSFQALVTSLRITEGEEATRQWLRAIQANQPKVYPSNTAIVQAVIRGEIDAGLTNHYYLLRAKQEQGDTLPAENYFLRNGDPGALINVSGAGILKTSRNSEAAHRLLEFLLSDEIQQDFAAQSFEYPLSKNVAADPGVVPLSEIDTPEIDLSDLSDLQRTLRLLSDTGTLH